MYHLICIQTYMHVHLCCVLMSYTYSVNEMTEMLFQYMTYGVGCVEIELDVLTGRVELLRADVLYDCGQRSVVPADKLLTCMHMWHHAIQVPYQLYMCTYVPTYIHTYIHTVCIYTQTYVHTYICTCIHTYMHTCIHTHIHTYTHTYIRTYIHTYICTCIRTCLCNNQSLYCGGSLLHDSPRPGR